MEKVSYFYWQILDTNTDRINSNAVFQEHFLEMDLEDFLHI